LLTNFLIPKQICRVGNTWNIIFDYLISIENLKREREKERETEIERGREIQRERDRESVFVFKRKKINSNHIYYLFI
jgi:hypothetical protein